MKTLFKTISILFIVAITISCSGSDSGSSSSNSNFIRAKINGVQYEETGSAIHSHDDGMGFDIDSKDATDTGMDFYIVGSPEVGTYTFNSTTLITVGKLNYRLNHETFSSGFCSVSNGTLTITSKNGNTIEGTFSFNASSMSESCANPSITVVTEGTFKIKVQ